MTRRPPHRRSRIGLGLAMAASLAACTATPRYPTDPGVTPGQGFEAVAPRYPIDNATAPPPPPAARSAATPDEAPTSARAFASARAVPTPTSRGDVDEAPLAPLVSRHDRAVGEPASTEPPRAAAAEDQPPPAKRVHRIPGALTYTLTRGDTLYGVARRFGVGPAALASANGLKNGGALQPGLRLKLPADSHDGGEQTHATGSASRAAARVVIISPPVARHAEVPPRARTEAEPAPTAGPIPYTQLVGRDRGRGHRDRSIASPLPITPSSPRDQAVAPAPIEREGEDDSGIMHAALGRFIRPVHGETLSTFGEKGPGQRNDGVDLAAREGEIVRASAAGVVVYAGHDVPALGNLVAVKHANGWVTVYGNLEKITVRATERLAQGAPLGVAGATSVTPTPKVHFEVRYAADPAEKAHPVDPDLILPKAG